jgi:hypothetical protein
MKRFVVEDALGEQKTFDAVDVLDPLGRQRLAFTTNPASVLLLGSRRSDCRAHPRFPAFFRRKSANHSFAVYRVRLGSQPEAPDVKFSGPRKPKPPDPPRPTARE